MKEQDLVCYLSVILHIYAKPGRKSSRFNIFESFTKHVCKSKRHHLKIVDTALTMRKHDIYETQIRHLRNANTAITKRDVNNKLCESSLNRY